MRFFKNTVITLLLCLFYCSCYYGAVYADAGQRIAEKDVTKNIGEDKEETSSDNNTDDDEDEYIEEENVYDPLEPINRSIFSFNDTLDTVFIRPLASAYRRFTPRWTKYVIENTVSTFFAPVRFVNFALQADAENAVKTMGRFAFNLIFGFFGTCDVAKVIGLGPTKNTTFGDTLKKWGVKSGPYVVLPVLGPTNFRGGIGMAVDQIPLSSANELSLYKCSESKRSKIKYSMTGTDMFLGRVGILDITDDMKKNSIDPYIITRSVVINDDSDNDDSGSSD
ncbi:MAG: VacJ family lipoprotein [Holosporales bacterium]|jgi:phospholipid-binding lipoprotein MlaA|nr:VacJ family lipoprotein [Holosporales bacterium]